jgi:hypothetical protein
VSKVPKVTVKTAKQAWRVLVVGFMVSLASGQQPAARAPGPAESLYLKLRTVGLDKTRVYKIREASLDRAELHISLDDGTIAFTEDAGGHITGAFFRGYGEVLLTPPSTMERASLALFTGAAILEETFSTAYFRFNDDVYSELQHSLRTAEDSDAFATEWGLTARNLAQEDALRVLLTLCDSPPAHAEIPSALGGDHMLHAFLQGNRLGTFDVRYDTLSSEQIAAGQHTRVEGEDYYDVWTSFAVPVPGKLQARPASQLDFEITTFKIQAEVRPATELSAKAILNLTAHQDGARTLVFELSRLLQVKDVRSDGKPVEFIHNQAIEGTQIARRGNDVIAVILPTPLRAGQKAELSFEYSGSVLSEAANGLLYVGAHGTWYPNRGMAMATFDVEFRYPAGWTLVATGRRTDAKTDGPVQSSRWVSERPVPLAGFNLGKYSQNVIHAGNVPITTYATSKVERGFATADDSAEPEIPGLFKSKRGVHPPLSLAPQGVPMPSPSQNTQLVGSASAKALEFYQKHFGTFPYSELAITQIPGTMSQGWPGLIFLSSYSFLTPGERDQLQSDPVKRLSSEQVIAHETAHQWWGDLVTWNGYRDQWMMEGLANYSAMMLLESHDPAKFRRLMQSYRDDLLGKTRKGLPLMDAGPVTLGVRLSSSQFPGAYEAICYGRGTWLFHMLRTMMRDGERRGAASSGRAKQSGDEPFLRALRKLRTNYENKAITTAQLMAVFESELPSSLSYEGHQSLDWFYQGWVNGNAVPSFDLHDLKFSDKGNTTLVTGTIVQGHAPDSLVTSLPLYASAGGKDVFLGRVFAEGPETQFRITAPVGTRKLALDPEQTLLTRNR